MAEKKISEKKIEDVKRFAEKIKSSEAIIILDVKGLPSKQFQDIKKKLRGSLDVEMAKKSILIRAIDAAGEGFAGLKEHVKENCAIGFSDSDAFEIAGVLSGNRNPIGAKAGQEAPEDIQVEAGATELMPGPAISELGALGLQVAVEEGKIAIKKSKVIVKKGEKVNEDAASIMQKLGIKPFLIGLEPIVIYDKKSRKIFTDVKIDKEKTVEELKTAKVKALGFAQKIMFYCRETIGYLLAKANVGENVLEKFVRGGETEKKEVKEGQKENKKLINDENKDEVKSGQEDDKDIKNKDGGEKNETN